jgi:hypothetical protein
MSPSGFQLLLVLFYFFAVVAVGVFVLVLLARFVRAQQRTADALSAIAEKLSTPRQ